MRKLDREEIERIVEEILRSKGYFSIMEKLATKDDLKLMMDFMDKRFNAIDKRFEAIDKRFEDLLHYVDKRFEELDKRFRIFTSVFFAFNIPLLLGILAILIKMVF